MKSKYSLTILHNKKFKSSDLSCVSLSVYLNVHQINWTLTSRAAPVQEFHLEIQVAIRRGDTSRKSSVCATIYLYVIKGVVDGPANGAPTRQTKTYYRRVN